MLEFLIKFFEGCDIAKSRNNIAIVKYVVENQESLDNLNTIDINKISDKKNEIRIYEELNIGNEYEFEIVLSSLRRLGFYNTCSDFITSNKKSKKEKFYIFEIKSSDQSDNIFIKNFLDIYSISEFINLLSIESQGERIILVENRYLKLNIDYCSEDISRDERFFSEGFITSFLDQYTNSSKEIKIIYKNELLEFLEPVNRNERFKYLFKNFNDFNEKCILGYEYYLSNFSYNKLKNELDNAVSDFHKNIRSVINDSQGKLIAIPASVLLVFTTVDTKEIIQDKNLFIFLASFIFALLMHLFIINQLNALSIIRKNKENYLLLFENKTQTLTLSEKVNISTEEINQELERQRCSLISINIINWIIPLGLLIYIYTYIDYLINNISF